MPNWVYNSVDNYSKDLYEKYKGETEAIDFNKVIPEPEELTKFDSRINDCAKKLYNYDKYIDEVKSDIADKPYNNLNSRLKYDNKNPLHRDLKDFAEYCKSDIADLVIENPDKSLNNLLDLNSDNDYIKFVTRNYNKYVSIFGNTAYNNCKDFISVYDKYRDMLEKDFLEKKESLTKSDKTDIDYSQFNSAHELGNYCEGLIEKYKADNWYTWRNIHWGCKWNASFTKYDEDSNVIRFNTPWAIPYQIIAKIYFNEKYKSVIS